MCVSIIVFVCASMPRTEEGNKQKKNKKKLNKQNEKKNPFYSSSGHTRINGDRLSSSLS